MSFPSSTLSFNPFTCTLAFRRLTARFLNLFFRFVSSVHTVWNATSYEGPIPIPDENKSLVLPLVLQHLTPTVVQFVGLGAVSAAVMSSSDSSLLGAASMFSRNVYKPLLRPNANEHEMLWSMRLAVLTFGITAAILGINVQSVYGLWYLSSDLVYVLLFPQLFCVVHLRSRCNTYGSAAAYMVGLILRVIGGEALLNLPAFLHYPFYNEVDGQLFPFRTFAMLSSMITLLIVSYAADRLFSLGYLKAHHDIFHYFHSVKPKQNETDMEGLSGQAPHNADTNNNLTNADNSKDNDIRCNSTSVYRSNIDPISAL